ncbi:Ldh family oxidoreductase [uncultured Sphingomonas sp.]|uniref:Ldh family oxidoreductase n=1 Tax=uncultured Sphingomonas sp. TaxID=158754 RepID=UPI0025F048AA|nr:Ldh family oxidoreductase [uncultured Sphingomonas sp.]
MTDTDGVKMSLDALADMSRTILTRHGLAPAHIEAVTRTIVAGERDGCASHGAYRLLVCINTLKTGKVVRDAEPRVAEPAPALARVDAGGGFAQLAFERGLPLLVQKARANGIAALAINHCVHFAALWPEIEALTEQGLVAFACTPSHAWVAPAGGTRPIFGTNPIAFGWPRADSPPFIFDFATSAVARGEIELHRRAGKAIPEGWGVDADGHPSTDPQAVLQGAMLTFGGHKGSALAAMVELLAGPLIGDLTSAESIALDAGAGSSPIGGEFVLAIDPAGFLGAEAAAHIARAEALFTGITDQGARLPSQRRYDARARSMRDGVVLPRALYDDLQALLA